jgi:hypothetical protein
MLGPLIWDVCISALLDPLPLSFHQAPLNSHVAAEKIMARHSTIRTHMLPLPGLYYEADLRDDLASKPLDQPSRGHDVLES